MYIFESTLNQTRAYIKKESKDKEKLYLAFKIVEYICKKPIEIKGVNKKDSNNLDLVFLLTYIASKTKVKEISPEFKSAYNRINEYITLNGLDLDDKYLNSDINELLENSPLRNFKIDEAFLNKNYTDEQFIYYLQLILKNHKNLNYLPLGNPASFSIKLFNRWKKETKHSADYDIMEYLTDYLVLWMPRRLEANKWIKKLPSRLKQDVKNNIDEFISILRDFSTLKYKEKENIWGKYFITDDNNFGLIQRFGNAKEFYEDLKNTIIAYTRDIKDFLDIMKSLGNQIEVVYGQNKIFIIKVKTYTASNKLGCGEASWCIIDQKGQWDSYTKNNNIQYFLFDFNNTDLLSRIGVTVDEKEWAHIFNKDNHPINKKNVEDYYKQYGININEYVKTPTREDIQHINMIKRKTKEGYEKLEKYIKKLKTIGKLSKTEKKAIENFFTNPDFLIEYSDKHLSLLLIIESYDLFLDNLNYKNLKEGHLKYLIKKGIFDLLKKVFIKTDQLVQPHRYYNDRYDLDFYINLFLLCKNNYNLFTELVDIIEPKIYDSYGEKIIAFLLNELIDHYSYHIKDMSEETYFKVFEYLINHQGYDDEPLYISGISETDIRNNILKYIGQFNLNYDIDILSKWNDLGVNNIIDEVNYVIDKAPNQLYLKDLSNFDKISNFIEGMIKTESYENGIKFLKNIYEKINVDESIIYFYVKKTIINKRIILVQDYLSLEQLNEIFEKSTDYKLHETYKNGAILSEGNILIKYFEEFLMFNKSIMDSDEEKGVVKLYLFEFLKIFKDEEYAMNLNNKNISNYNVKAEYNFLVDSFKEYLTEEQIMIFLEKIEFKDDIYDILFRELYMYDKVIDFLIENEKEYDYQYKINRLKDKKVAERLLELNKKYPENIIISIADKTILYNLLGLDEIPEIKNEKDFVDIIDKGNDKQIMMALTNDNLEKYKKFYTDEKIFTEFHTYYNVKRFYIKKIIEYYKDDLSEKYIKDLLKSNNQSKEKVKYIKDLFIEYTSKDIDNILATVCRKDFDNNLYFNIDLDNRYKALYKTVYSWGRENNNNYKLSIDAISDIKVLKDIIDNNLIDKLIEYTENENIILNLKVNLTDIKPGKVDNEYLDMLDIILEKTSYDNKTRWKNSLLDNISDIKIIDRLSKYYSYQDLFNYYVKNKPSKVDYGKLLEYLATKGVDYMKVWEEEKRRKNLTSFGRSFLKILISRNENVIWDFNNFSI
jgi:hypothetical protein